MGLSITFITCLVQIGTAKEDSTPLVFACNANNDLFQTVTACNVACVRTDDPVQAVVTARAGAGMLLLADDYPGKLLEIPAQVFETAAHKNLRLYVEYPSSMPGLTVGAPTASPYELAVVTSATAMAGRCTRVLRARGRSAPGRSTAGGSTRSGVV